MFARVSRFQETTDSIEEALTRSTDVVERAKALSGFEGLYYLVDRESGKTMAITLWRTEQAMLNSEEAANHIRMDEATATGSQIVAVEHYEVASAELL
jgi:heme-degrading monooxygenase HmoA